MGKALIIDLAICNGCHNCQIACKDEHVANDWTPIAKTPARHRPVLEQGHRPGAGLGAQGAGDLSPQHLPALRGRPLPHGLQRRAPSTAGMTASSSSTPPNARVTSSASQACPYENVIYFNDDLNIAQKCTFCAHLLDAGWTETRCSDACPTGAFTFGDEEDPTIAEKIASAEPAETRACHPAPGLLPQPSQEVDSRRRLRSPGRRVPGRGHGHRHQHATGADAHRRHRQLRGLLAEGPRRRRLHPAHREDRATYPRSWDPSTPPRPIRMWGMWSSGRRESGQDPSSRRRQDRRGRNDLRSRDDTAERTIVRDMCFLGANGGANACMVDVNDGKMLRIRPMHYYDQYTKEEVKPWVMNARGKTFEPERQDACRRRSPSATRSASSPPPASATP